MAINQEESIILTLMFVGYISFLYYAYLAWKKPDRFRAMAEKSLWWYGNSQAMKEWFHTKSYIWLARFLLLIPVGTLSFLFGSLVWGYIVQIRKKIIN